jgi:uncharacterized PurR-regulated membrane protein YhhQ (DUF165 family)
MREIDWQRIVVPRLVWSGCVRAQILKALCRDIHLPHLEALVALYTFLSSGAAHCLSGFHSIKVVHRIRLFPLPLLWLRKNLE